MQLGIRGLSSHKCLFHIRWLDTFWTTLVRKAHGNYKPKLYKTLQDTQETGIRTQHCRKSSAYKRSREELPEQPWDVEGSMGSVVSNTCGVGWGEASQGHFPRYVNVGPLCYTPETTGPLHVHCDWKSFM